MNFKTPAPDAPESSPGLWLPTGPREPTDFGDTLPPDSVPFEQQIDAALRPPRHRSGAGEDTQRIDDTGIAPPMHTAAATAIPVDMAGPKGLMGRYVLEKPLGAGGLGTVWAAYDTVLARQVAVKTLPLAVLARPGFSLRALGGPAATRFAEAQIPTNLAPKLVTATPPAWCFIPMPLRPESSTAIRRRAKAQAV